jgi:probable lipoprotein NlpC
MTQKIRSGLHRPGIIITKNRFLIPLCAILLTLPFSAQAQAITNGPALLNTERKPESLRNDFIEGARSYLGTPYVRGGTTGDGMDCSGLVYRAALECTGMQVPRTVAALAARASRIMDTAREPGDLLFFNTTGKLTHVGIYLGGGTFIHSASDGPRTGVIISNLSETYWKNAYSFAGRLFAQENVNIPKHPDTAAPEVNPFPFSGRIGFRIDITGGALWDLMPGEIPARGGNANVEISWVKGFSAYPGIGAGLSWDARKQNCAIPLTFSLTMPWGFRVYLGTQIHLAAAPGIDRTPQFPGIAGISWNSKPVRLFGQNIRFYQGAEYSILPGETNSTGFRLNTGLTLSYDI